MLSAPIFKKKGKMTDSFMKTLTVNGGSMALSNKMKDFKCKVSTKGFLSKNKGIEHDESKKETVIKTSEKGLI